jgi:hypothetical protein
MMSLLEGSSLRHVGVAFLRAGGSSTVRVLEFADTAAFTHTLALIELLRPNQVFLPIGAAKSSPLAACIQRQFCMDGQLELVAVPRRAFTADPSDFLRGISVVTPELVSGLSLDPRLVRAKCECRLPRWSKRPSERRVPPPSFAPSRHLTLFGSPRIVSWWNASGGLVACASMPDLRWNCTCSLVRTPSSRS